MTPNERLDALNQAIEAIRSGWLFFCAHLSEREAELTQSLIAQDNEQTRGRIKQLRELKELPETLISERESISAALAEMAAAD